MVLLARLYALMVADTLTFGPGGYWTCIAWSGIILYRSGNVGIGTDDPGAYD